MYPEVQLWWHMLSFVVKWKLLLETEKKWPHSYFIQLSTWGYKQFSDWRAWRTKDNCVVAEWPVLWHKQDIDRVFKDWWLELRKYFRWFWGKTYALYFVEKERLQLVSPPDRIQEISGHVSMNYFSDIMFIIWLPCFVLVSIYYVNIV